MILKHYPILREVRIRKEYKRDNKISSIDKSAHNKDHDINKVRSHEKVLDSGEIVLVYEQRSLVAVEERQDSERRDEEDEEQERVDEMMSNAQLEFSNVRRLVVGERKRQVVSHPFGGDFHLSPQFNVAVF